MSTVRSGFTTTSPLPMSNVVTNIKRSIWAHIVMYKCNKTEKSRNKRFKCNSSQQQVAHFILVISRLSSSFENLTISNNFATVP